jgi:ankyrin repeat protein
LLRKEVHVINMRTKKKRRVLEQPAPSQAPSPVQPDVNALDADGRTALHSAVQKGQRQVVQQLLEAGADVEARTRPGGKTPLHLAAAAGNADLVPLLITPATLEAEDDDGHTALQLAVKGRWLTAATALVEAGASPTAALFGDTAAPTAFSSVDWDQGVNLVLLSALLSAPGSEELRGQALRWRDERGQTLLHRAAYHGCRQLVAALVEAGADRDAVDRQGATPLWLAARYGEAELVPLLATPANINLPDVENRSTPLLAATGTRYSGEAVASLLAAGASVHVQDPDKRSPLDLAAMGGCTKALAALLAAIAKECKQQEGKGQQQPPAQQQERQQPSPLPRRQQQQQQQQQQGQTNLVALVAAAVAPQVEDMQDTSCCTSLIEVVLDVLGPKVAEQVCLKVQQLLEQNRDGQQQLRPAPGYKAAGCDPMSHLAEALLLGGLDAVERLRSAQPRVVKVLRRMVPGVQDGSQQQQQQHEQDMLRLERRLLGWDRDGYPSLDEYLLRKRLVRLVKKAALAAAAGQEQEVLRLLKQFAALNHWADDFLDGHCGKAYSDLEEFVHQGLQKAADAQQGVSGVKHGMVQQQQPGGCNRLHHAASIHPPAVYTTFLAAWVRARRQLQQLPREKAAAVVAAVEYARQQQQRRQGVPGGKRLPSQLSILLLEAGGAAALAGG